MQARMFTTIHVKLEDATDKQMEELEILLDAHPACAEYEDQGGWVSIELYQPNEVANEHLLKEIQAL